MDRCMNVGEVLFEISAVEKFHTAEQPASDTIGRVMEAMIGMRFSTVTGSSNSNQFSSSFDADLAVKLRQLGCDVKEDRYCPELARSAEIKWAGRPDLLLEFDGTQKIIVEIEKSNKFKIWDDLMKLWLLTEEANASLGLLVCPKNYVSRKADWDLFAYARRCLLLLERSAKVSRDHLSHVAVIGYTQALVEGSELVPWNRAARNNLAARPVA